MVQQIVAIFLYHDNTLSTLYSCPLCSAKSQREHDESRVTTWNKDGIMQALGSSLIQCDKPVWWSEQCIVKTQAIVVRAQWELM